MQVFTLFNKDGKQMIVHEQEVPPYKKEYLLVGYKPINAKIFVITEIYPSTKIIKEFYTRTRQDRPNWTSLINQIKTGDTIIFDSVSRMSRNATEGFKDYKALYEMGVNLSKNNIYLVKGDSPLSVLHFPKLKLYVYASTDEILYKALIDSPIFPSIKRGEYEQIPIDEGEILKICPDGRIERGEFDFHYYRGRYNWWDYGVPYSYSVEAQSDSSKDYLESLKRMALYQGYSPGLIDDLLAEGFSLDEIEMYLYDYETA